MSPEEIQRLKEMEEKSSKITEQEGDMVIYTIYDKPKDYPEHYVMRMLIVRDTKVIFGPLISKEKTLAEVRKKLKPGMVMMPSYENDDRAILETWM